MGTVGTHASIIVAASVAAGVCTASSTVSGPAWLQSKITELELRAPGNPPRAILRTMYRGRTVYYLTPTCCDIPSELYEESGELVCRPDGGFAGGDGRCKDFTLAPDSATVWRDERGSKEQTRK